MPGKAGFMSRAVWLLFSKHPQRRRAVKGVAWVSAHPSRWNLNMSGAVGVVPTVLQVTVGPWPYAPVGIRSWLY